MNNFNFFSEILLALSLFADEATELTMHPIKKAKQIESTKKRKSSHGSGGKIMENFSIYRDKHTVKA
jgi:hypothetical protein